MKRRKLRIANKFRFTVFMTIVCFILIGTVGTLLGLNTAESAEIPQYTKIYVRSGDTLWSLAEQHGSSSLDTRKVIYEISLLNNLDDDYIYPGQVLTIPLYNSY